MMRWQSSWLAFLLPLVMVLQPLRGEQEPDGFRHFVYLSDKRIITLELLDEERAILNYINLDNVYELIESFGILVVDSAGNNYLGHLFKNEAAQGESLYSVTDLLEPKEYKGYEVVGNFRVEGAPRKGYLRLGSRLVELEPLSEDDFEVFAGKVGEVDLESEPRLALDEAGFWRGFGQLHPLTSSEIESVAGRFPREKVLPPMVLKNPAPLLPSELSHLTDPVVVKVKLRVSTQGGMQNLEVTESPDPRLNDRARQAVLNSWVFLPAVSEGKIAAAELVVQVVFRR